MVTATKRLENHIIVADEAWFDEFNRGPYMSKFVVDEYEELAPVHHYVVQYKINGEWLTEYITGTSIDAALDGEIIDRTSKSESAVTIRKASLEENNATVVPLADIFVTDIVVLPTGISEVIELTEVYDSENKLVTIYVTVADVESRLETFLNHSTFLVLEDYEL